jgi:hypothetical protein
MGLLATRFRFSLIPVALGAAMLAGTAMLPVAARQHRGAVSRAQSGKSVEAAAASPAGGARRRALEERIKKQLRVAELAESYVEWHEERARFWQKVADDQMPLGDFCSACDPLAEFKAQTHSKQSEESRKRARQLREESARLNRELSRLPQ